MKKVIKLTESDLENIVKRVISEQNSGVAFGHVGNGFSFKSETTEQETPTQKNLLIEKWVELFPSPSWYASVRNKKFDFQNYNDVKDPEFKKLYNVYRLFIDYDVPPIEEDTIEDFYSWMEKTTRAGNFYDMKTKFNDDLKKVNQLQRGMIPVLKMSNYPNPDPYETAFRKAIRIDQDMKTNRYYSAIHPVPKKAYEYITGK